MAENLALALIENKVHEPVGDILVMLIDHDSSTTASLTLMLEQLSYKVMNVNVTSKAISMMQEREDIGFVIANIEMPQIDSHSFRTYMLHNNIPLILISPEIPSKKTSDFLIERACFFLQKPISENDMQNLWEHVAPKKKSEELEKINIGKKQKNVMSEEIHVDGSKRQRTSQASLLGRKSINKTITTSTMYKKRRNIISSEIVNVESNRGRNTMLWTEERHMKFLAAISKLGDENSRPKAILKMMKDPSLTQLQVSSHLQKYKTQIKDVTNILKNETVKNPSNQLIPVGKPNGKKKMKKVKLYLGGMIDLINHPFLDSILAKPSMELECLPSTSDNKTLCVISPTDDASHNFPVPTSLGSGNLDPILSDLPSSVGASSSDPFQLPDSFFETIKNQMTPYPTLENCYVSDQDDPCPMGEDTANPFETDINQSDSIFSNFDGLNSLAPLETDTTFSQTGINHMGHASSGQSLVPNDEDSDVPIEDLLTFDHNIKEMDMQSLRGNLISSTNDHNHEATTNTSFEPVLQIHDERGDNLDEDLMDWIGRILKED